MASDSSGFKGNLVRRFRIRPVCQIGMWDKAWDFANNSRHSGLHCVGPKRELGTSVTCLVVHGSNFFPDSPKQVKNICEKRERRRAQWRRRIFDREGDVVRII